MHKNKNLLILLFLLVFAAGTFLFVPGTNAAPAPGLQYTLLEKIPGTDNVGSDLKGYLEAIYKVALIIIVLSAVLMLSIGGFMYLTSAGNTSAMGTAKGVIFDSIIGLVIALTAYLLLYVINPDLVNITINGLSPTAVPGAPPKAPPTAPPPTGAAWPDDTKEREALAAVGISINKGTCKTVGQTGCTSMAESAAIQSLIDLQKQCGNCIKQVTGGTECWLHNTKPPVADPCSLPGNHHNRGDSAVDIAHGDIDSYITSKGTVICTFGGRNLYQIGNSVFWNEDAAHWHANFNKSVCQSF